MFLQLFQNQGLGSNTNTLQSHPLGPKALCCTEGPGEINPVTYGQTNLVFHMENGTEVCYGKQNTLVGCFLAINFNLSHFYQSVIHYTSLHV